MLNIPFSSVVALRWEFVSSTRTPSTAAPVCGVQATPRDTAETTPEMVRVDVTGAATAGVGEVIVAVLLSPHDARKSAPATRHRLVLDRWIATTSSMAL